MTLSVANLKIRRVVIHQIDRRDENGNRPLRYSDALTALEEDGLSLLTERVTAALGRDSHSVEMMVRDDEEGSTLQIAASLIYEDDSRFLAGSKVLTRKLADSQGSRQIPGGVVVVFSGTTGEESSPMIGIIKAETHAGFTQEVTPTTISLRYLANLLLTPQQKLYKIGLLVDLRESDQRATTPSANDFGVLVYDHHMTQSATQNAAIYFYDLFLGCTILRNSRQLTKAFYDDTRDFIDDLTVDEATKFDLNMGLHAYLTASTRQQVHVGEFGEEYFSGDRLAAYQLYMADKDFPANAVPKDTTALKRVLKLRKITFSSNVKVVGPAEGFKDIVSIEKTDETDVTLVRIKGTIKKQA